MKRLLGLLFVAASCYGQFTTIPNRAAPPSGPAGGGLTGTYPNPTLVAPGSDGQYEYNSSGAFAGSDILSRDGTNRRNVMTRAGVEFGFVADPSAAPVATLVVAAGNVDAGQHAYCFSFVTAQGETQCSDPSNIVTTDGTHGQVTVGTFQACPTGVTGRKLYRTYADSINAPAFLANVTCAATTYTDNIADSALTDGSTINTTAGYYYFNSTPIGYFTNRAFRFGTAPTTTIGEQDFMWLRQELTNPGWTGGTNPAAFRLDQIYTANANSGNDFPQALSLSAETSGTGNIDSHEGINVQNFLGHTGTSFATRGITIATGFQGVTTTSNSTSLSTYGTQYSGTIAGYYAIDIAAYNKVAGSLTNLVGLNIGNQNAGTNNWAIKTGLGKVQWGDVEQQFNSAGNPNATACSSAIYGATYFNTTDKRLCVCANDGTDDKWVKSSDYTHATGHCTP